MNWRSEINNARGSLSIFSLSLPLSFNAADVKKKEFSWDILCLFFFGHQEREEKIKR